MIEYRKRQWITLLLTIVPLIVPSVALARIKLITLPKRERVEIQLDHPNVTLVEEERIVPLLKGVNHIDFSWANATIDKDSIQFRALVDPDKVKVLSVSYPPHENALVWQVYAAESGSAKVRISYIIGQLNKSFEYRATASHDEKTMVLSQYIRLHNLAREDFGDAGMWAGFSEHFIRPIGLDETKQVLSAKFADVPITKTYTCNPAEFDYLDRAQNQLRVPMHYVIKNDTQHRLGQFPLMYGKARIFQKDGKGSVAFIGEDWGEFTPVDDEMKLYLGLARDIVVKRTIERRDKIRVGGNLYNYDVVIKYEIENFKDLPATLDVTESLRHIRREILSDKDRDVDWELGKETTFVETFDKEKSTFDKVIFHIPLPPRIQDDSTEKVIHKLHVTIKNEW